MNQCNIKSENRYQYNSYQKENISKLDYLRKYHTKSLNACKLFLENVESFEKRRLLENLVAEYTNKTKLIDVVIREKTRGANKHALL